MSRSASFAAWAPRQVQVKPQDLGGQLAGGLAPAYLVAGDETLLVQEACDAVLEAARAEGFSERELIDGAPGVDWNATFASAGNLSLFGDRRVLDVRLAKAVFDRKASEAIRGYLAAPFADTLLLIRAPRLEPRQRSDSWFKALDKAGVVVRVWPLSLRELPGWLEGRCRRAGVTLTPEALAALAERVEGNLLAAVQEIEKLQLVAGSKPMDAAAVRDAVGDASRYDAFELLDAVCAGQAGRVRKMIHVLRQEAVVSEFMVMGALNRQLRDALRLAAGGRPRLPPQRARALERLSSRLGATRLERALAESALLDQQAKGMLRGDAWLSLERLLVFLAGCEGAGSLTREARHLQPGSSH